MIHTFVDILSQQWKRAILGLFLVLVGYYVIRSCIPGLNGSLLPASFLADLEQRYVNCMSDVPIWPGEHRQPDCGQVDIKTLGKGVLPPQSVEEGITQAVCYIMTYKNPRWTTQGAVVGHDIVWYGWTLSKMAVLQNGVWQAYPDESSQDELRWAAYKCPGPYELKSIQNADQ
jgi:hypothetical protein